MQEYAVWYISLFVFGAVFNLAISLVMFYLRLAGSPDRYTRSQLWAMTLMAFLFLYNSVWAGAEAGSLILGENAGKNVWLFHCLFDDMSHFTGFLLISFGLVYPRPFMVWSRLKYLLYGIVGAGVLLLLVHSYLQHADGALLFSMNLGDIEYLLVIFIPLFIWISEYSQEPSKEARMIYTILIWGFLFVMVAQNMLPILLTKDFTKPMGNPDTYRIALTLIVLIRFGVAIWKQRKRWSQPENLNILLFGLALITGTIGGILPLSGPSEVLNSSNYRYLFGYFLTNILGWLMVRPVLFSYGLLRYQLLGTQVKPEKALAVLTGVIASTIWTLALLNILSYAGVPFALPIAIAVGLALFFPSLLLSKRMVLLFLPATSNIEDMSMRQRRNIYLMGLKTSSVAGEEKDPWDETALQNLKSELSITDREHELLVESIELHDVHTVPQRIVSEAFLIHRAGLLVAHYSEKAEGSAIDSDIFAGMFTAISEYVSEALKAGGKADRGAHSISYGPTSLVVERDGHLVLAALITGSDDYELRQLMRDTLSEVREGYGSALSEKWDGRLEGLDGVKGILTEFSNKVRRRG